MSNPQTKRTCLSLLFVIIILIIAFLIFLTVIYVDYKNQSLVVTKLGKVLGITVNRIGKKIDCYYGVPYAEPPIGQLRFKKPVPKKPWKDVLKAIKQPNYCWQPMRNNDFRKDHYVNEVLKYVPDWEIFFGNDVSEDCLYLNIYAPIRLNAQQNRTVMVWIHGGSFKEGHISSTYYDGSILAASSDVIVVTINYRLGLFGFLYADQTDLSGNYGLHDQVMAFKWIKDNIDSFGGNPNNIVIFGESAGAISVGYHLISPLSDNLFSRAILQSGNAVLPIAIAGQDLQRNATIDVIKGALCPLPPKLSDNATQQLDNSSISCLRQVNASILFELYRNISGHRIGAFLPIEDNDFFPEHPYEMVKKRRFNSNKEILIGTNAVEGAYFARIGPFGQFWSKDKVSQNFTKENVIKTLKLNTPEGYRGFVQIAIDQALEGVENYRDPVEVWERYIKIVGDIIFVCSDYVFINEYSISNRTVYYYEFKPKPSFSPWSPAWAKGAIHGDDIAFVFGIPLVLPKLYSLEEIELSKTIMNVWTNFAKSGKPSCCNSWLEYKYYEPLYMSLDIKDKGCQMKQGFPGYKCKQYYEQLITEARNYMRSGKEISFKFKFPV